LILPYLIPVLSTVFPDSRDFDFEDNPA
jgi:hypothetical protein